MGHLLVVQHDQDAPAGLLADWATSRGQELRTVRLHAGDPLPGEAEAAAFDAAVVLGSEQTAYDDSVPWLAAELALVERFAANARPVLGICFGGQVLARVLGARLYRLAEPEIGLIDVSSRTSAIAAGPWPSWHRDAFELPPGAVELARNPVSCQAFGYGPHLGLQFHPEATQPIVASWLAAADPAAGRAAAGQGFGGDTEAAWKQAADHARALFSAWHEGRLAPAA